MAIALVGSAGAITTATSGTTVQATFAQATTAGHLLVCVAGLSTSGGSPSLSTTSSGWSVAGSASGTNAQTTAAIFYKANCGASETAPTITLNLGGGTIIAGYAELSEWSGVATASPVDQSQNAGALTAQNPAVDATSGELAISAISGLNSKSATYTISTAWTPSGGTITSLNNTGGTKASSVFMGSADVMSSNSAVDKAVWTCTPSTGSLAAVQNVIASFKLPSGFQPRPPAFDFSGVNIL